jgi:hypothetical protein
MHAIQCTRARRDPRPRYPHAPTDPNAHQDDIKRSATKSTTRRKGARAAGDRAEYYILYQDTESVHMR